MTPIKTRLIVYAAITVLTCISQQSSAQTTSFEMVTTNLKVHNSHYNRLIFLDSRIDTISLGHVQKGLLNQRTGVVAKRPMQEQIGNLFTELTDSSAQMGTLLFQLRQLSFTELTTTTRETGYCTFRAKLYQFNGDKYTELSGIDTVISVNAIDVTNRLYKAGSKLITKFIADNLIAAPLNTNAYSYVDLVHMDSIEKSTMKLFAVSAYSNGLYKNYNSFKNQVPDYKQVSCQVKGDEITILKIEDEHGKQVVSKESYALVHDGKPYILTAAGNYLLRKEGDDLCFTGLYRSGTNTSTTLANAALFGAVGVLLTNDFKGTNYYDIKLDYLNGSFIPFHQLDKNELKLKRKSGQIPSPVYKDDSY